MEITGMRFTAPNTNGNIKAYVAVTFDNSFAVHELRVINGKKGMFVGMPSRRAADDEFLDIAHPTSTDFRNYLTSTVLNAYEEWANNKQ